MRQDKSITITPLSPVFPLLSLPWLASNSIAVSPCQGKKIVFQGALGKLLCISDRQYRTSNSRQCKLYVRHVPSNPLSCHWVEQNKRLHAWKLFVLPCGSVSKLNKDQVDQSQDRGPVAVVLFFIQNYRLCWHRKSDRT